MRECEKDFAGHQDGYEESIQQQEETWRWRHHMAKYFEKIYSPLAWVDSSRVSRDAGCGVFFVLNLVAAGTGSLPAYLSCLTGIGALLSVFAPAVKWQFFDFRTDFDSLQTETEDTLQRIRKVKLMGRSISLFYQDLAFEIANIIRLEKRFENIQRTLPRLKAQKKDVSTWDSHTLGDELHRLELKDCAAIFLNANISGHAFLHVLKEKDFKDLGIADELSLRRLLDMQARMLNDKQEILRNASIGPQLKEALNEVVGQIRRLKEKYSYA